MRIAHVHQTHRDGFHAHHQHVHFGIVVGFVFGNERNFFRRKMWLAHVYGDLAIGQHIQHNDATHGFHHHRGFVG